MEDAMIINKGSCDRGFEHAHLLTSKLLDLNDYKEPGQQQQLRFGRCCCCSSSSFPVLVFPPPPRFFSSSLILLAPSKQTAAKPKDTKTTLDSDGLPKPGTRIKEGDLFYGYIDDSTHKTSVVRYKGEPAVIQQVSLLATDNNGDAPKASVQLFIPRVPVIGDKFASRAGQKGVLSQVGQAFSSSSSSLFFVLVSCSFFLLLSRMLSLSLSIANKLSFFYFFY